MSKKLSERMHAFLTSKWDPRLPATPDEVDIWWAQVVEQFITEVVTLEALEAKLETNRLEISVLTRRVEDAEVKVIRQAEQITRLETSRQSLREALAVAQEEQGNE